MCCNSCTKFKEELVFTFSLRKQLKMPAINDEIWHKGYFSKDTTVQRGKFAFATLAADCQIKVLHYNLIQIRCPWN